MLIRVFAGHIDDLVGFVIQCLKYCSKHLEIRYDGKIAWQIRGRSGAVVRASDFGTRGPWFEPWPGAVRCGIEQVTFTPCLVLVKPRKRWTDD